MWVDILYDLIYSDKSDDTNVPIVEMVMNNMLIERNIR